jgi:hypothetical protein
VVLVVGVVAPLPLVLPEPPDKATLAAMAVPVLVAVEEVPALSELPASLLVAPEETA